MSAFEFASIDGYYAGPKGEIDFFKNSAKDTEFEAFTHKNAQQKSTLVFGRITYEMMAAFWPTDQAKQVDPVMYESMNNNPKVVFSKTLKQEDIKWKGVTVLKDLKHIPNSTIPGAGSIVQQLINKGMLDEINLVVMPTALGEGKSLFNGVNKNLKLIESKSFKNGNVFLKYKTA